MVGLFSYCQNDYEVPRSGTTPSYRRLVLKGKTSLFDCSFVIAPAVFTFLRFVFFFA